ncbi:MAG: hypothetical protein QOJ69_962, partial [Actinomycetota bacterium]|nr:hypothetical protein [Actinomycetota bacterium]
MPAPSLVAAAGRLATLLTAGGGGLSDPAGGDLEFEALIEVSPLEVSAPPEEVWAV